MRQNVDTQKKLTKKEKEEYEYVRGLVDSLVSNVVRFDFLKLDGSLRTMLGTRNPGVIEENEGKKDRIDELANEQNLEVQIKNDALVVYDLEAKGFRSFKPSRLVKNRWEELKIVGNGWEGNEPPLLEDKKREIIELLISNELDIVFTKIDGSERFMKATRKESYETRMSEINTPEAIKSQLESGKVPVFDLEKGEMRAFNLGRLKNYKLASETDYKEVNFSVEEVVEAAEKIDNYDIFNPQNQTTEEVIEMLNTKVVRLVFKKKDNTLRVMYATRVKEVIELYSKRGAKLKGNEPGLNSEEKIAAQIKGDYITIFDLEAREFKTFKPSTLLKFDVERGVGSWIEFKVEDDGWFRVIYEGMDIRDLYVKGSPEAKEIGEEVSAKRVKFEYKQKEYKNLKENLKTVGDEAERYTQAMKLVDKVVKEENADLTSADLMVYNKLKELGEKVKEKYEEADNKEMVLSEVKVLDSKKLVIFIFNWGRDVFVFHPKFAFNGVTYKVYADRTGKIDFNERARVSKAEKNFLPILKLVVPVISRRRKKDKLNKELSEADLRRLRRVYVISKSKEDLIDGVGLKFDFRAENGAPVLLRITTSDKSRKELVITPGFIYDNAKKLMIFERENEWKTVKEFVENVYTDMGVLNLSVEQSKVIVKILALAYDLRKPVIYKDKKI